MTAITVTWGAPHLPLPTPSRARLVAARRPATAPAADAGRAARAPITAAGRGPEAPRARVAPAPRPTVVAPARPAVAAAPRPAAAARSASGRVASQRVDHAARPAVRVTRRGRLLASLAVGAVVVTGALSAQSAVADDPGEAVTVVARTVTPGETLWSIAGSVAQPGEDLRDVVDRLEVLNGLSGSAIQAGQELLVPAP